MFRFKAELSLHHGLAVLTALVGILVVFIFLFLLQESWPLLSKISPSRLFTDPSWHPSEEYYNVSAMVVATLLATLGALAIAAPLGIAFAIYCEFYAAPYLSKALSSILELLAGIPSVVFGLWGLVVLVPVISSWEGPGTSLLAGIIILSIMILPTGALLARSSLANTAQQWRQASAALGLSRWAMVKTIALPASKTGLINALIIQAGRALGETMAVLMVCGNIVAIPDSLFAPVRTLSANIALEMAYAMGDHRAALYSTGLILLILVTALLCFSRPNLTERSHA
ncbi:phosphate ABC transporter permease subunit PstC [Pseudoteredinibacter isoporae]|uniref:phosphate ABC transporter permease subunit PstC n=1 Tax=Pseudoteredinibacter isoporae TaxID=570281 RepID=UPI00310AA289